MTRSWIHVFRRAGASATSGSLSPMRFTDWSPGVSERPPAFFEFRLGLSATPERQYDPEGTQALEDYFGPQVFEFGLNRAIGVCLVPFDYYVHLVELEADELAEWRRLTEKIKKQLRVSRMAGTADDEQRLRLLLDQTPTSPRARAQEGLCVRFRAHPNRDVRHPNPRLYDGQGPKSTAASRITVIRTLRAYLPPGDCRGDRCRTAGGPGHRRLPTRLPPGPDRESEC